MDSATVLQGLLDELEHISPEETRERQERTLKMFFALYTSVFECAPKDTVKKILTMYGSLLGDYIPPS